MTKQDFDSENLYREWLQVEKNLSEKMQSGLRWIKENDSDAVIIGAMAVANYLLIPRKLTPDVDFLSANIEKVKIKLEESLISFRPLYNSIGITVEKFNLDLLDSEEGNKKLNAFALSNYRFIKVAGVVVRMVTVEALTIMKFSSGREKDEADAFNLLKSGAINKEKFQREIKRFGKHIPNQEDLIRYSEIIS